MSGNHCTRKQSKSAAPLEEAARKADEVDLNEPMFIEFMARWGERYSDRNLRLLWVQRSTAVELHTYNGWLSHGRQVRKGESSIVLNGFNSREIETESGETTTQKWIRPISLFDIAQTDAINKNGEAA